MSKKTDTNQNKPIANPIASRLQEISSEFDRMVTSEHHHTDSSEMKKKKLVQKRDGSYQPVSFDKIRDRISNFSEDLDECVDPIELAQEVISCIYDKIQTKELDELAARKAHNRCFVHPDWDRLASRISISNHHKETIGVFSEVIFELHRNKLVNDAVFEIVKSHEAELNEVVDYTRDFALDYTGFQYFLKTYADRTIEFDENGNEIQGPIIERFQDMLMKVSLGIHRDDLESAIETYQYWSCLLFTHATPTIFSAHKEKSQCSSCFLIAMKEEDDWPYDSIDKIYETLSDCAKISKLAGGIGLSISNVRAKGTIIHSVGRPSDGIVPMCKVFNQTARYVDQGRRRKGAFSIFLEPWHPDIIDFLQLKKDDGGSEDLRAKDLFYALWVPDLFMDRVDKNEVWSLIDPMVCPELYKTNGKEFEEHYLRCEREKKYAKQMPARTLYYEIIVAQIETGTPYMCFKDHSNVKSNQKNLGTIRSSNLCVSGDTRILTKTGYQQIIDLQNKQVDIWNGFEWSNVAVKQTGTNQELMKITFSNGAAIKCTPYHKFYTNIDRYRDNRDLEAFSDKNKTKMVEAKELKIDDKLIKHDFPILEDVADSFPQPYTHGFFCGDGTYGNVKESQRRCSFKASTGGFCERHQYYNTEHKPASINDGMCEAEIGDGNPILMLYAEKKLLQDKLDYRNDYENEGRQVLQLDPHLPRKFTVPMNNSMNDKLLWLAGLCDSDGCICRNGSNESIQIGSIEFKFLNDIRLMLSTIGIHTKVTLSKKAGQTLMPDGKGGKKLFDTQDLYRLIISSTELVKLTHLGFKTHRLKISGNIPQRNARQFVKVTNIEYLAEPENTYCFTEPKLGLGIFEGIATGQCSEIVEYSDSNEIAVCNLSSICLHRFIDVNTEGKNEFNHSLLHEATKILVRNLNKVIDINYYPNDETRNSNFKHRPIGIGIQGLADTFFKLRYPFESPEAAQLNSEIAETIYFAALEASCELAEEDGPYESYEGSPVSQGILQFDMWPAPQDRPITTNRWNWEELRANIRKYGIRNSLLIALMPTASTSFLMGSAESFEPLNSNYYNSSAAVGTFKRINKYLIHDMIERGLWNADMRNAIIANNGSVLNVPNIPEDIQTLYKTVWEISQKVLIDLSAERGRFTCQSQSLNQYLVGDKDDTSIVGKLSSLHMYAWKKGLKTGMYYLRTQAAKDAIKSTIDPALMKKTQLQNAQAASKAAEGKVGENDENGGEKKDAQADADLEEAKMICRRDNKEDCLMCGS